MACVAYLHIYVLSRIGKRSSSCKRTRKLGHSYGHPKWTELGTSVYQVTGITKLGTTYLTLYAGRLVGPTRTSYTL